MTIDGGSIMFNRTDQYIILALLMALIWWISSRIPNDENKPDNAGG
jgi:hypothetical protein